MLLLAVLVNAAALHAAIPAIERNALIALYNAAGGDNWRVNSGWKDGALEQDGFGPIGSEGNWYGIEVSGDHVTKIDLARNKLNGAIPPELGNLSHLEELYLDGSVSPYYFADLVGGIPPELGNLNQLKYLSLSSNELSGSIPSELGNLNQLESLDLGWNELGGDIPPELGNLDHLKNLNLAYNRLIRGIPPELGNLSQLETLVLDYNNLGGGIPPELGNLGHLTTLSLFQLQLNGGIPPELGNLSRLERLNLYRNGLSGSIPSELGNLNQLKYLSLSSNELSGSIPSELGNLDNLIRLSLSDNQLSGSIPPELGSLGHLEFLDFGNNRLSGGIPPELGNLGHLENLFLGRNRLSGGIPSSLINLTQISNIYFAYNALYASSDEVREFINNNSSVSWEKTQTIAPADVSVTGTSLTSARVSWSPIVYTGGPGGYRVYCSTTSGGPWNFCGSTASKTDSFYDVTGLSPGTTYYFKILTRTGPHIRNKNTVLSEYSEVVSAGIGIEELHPPFGSFDTPIDGLIARGSIAVTGWALDDTGIDSVKIYRDLRGQLVYIGDAVLVAGARPDVAAAYPGYPNNTKAGWGYMLLTNFLPGNGNGAFVLYAIATDIAGKTTNLGSKTILCDNDNAVKPFGAIDTPTQGGPASGNRFVNFGWALTPLPNTIPIDGSTITVWVDGVPLGNPVYNQYRGDIAGLFPGYNNSNGAVGYFYLDTTGYDNGVHTIQWTVEDDAGNHDGIGSRYFTVQNPQNPARANSKMQTNTHARAMPYMDIQIRGIPLDTMAPLTVKKGYNHEQSREEKRYGHNEPGHIDIPELGRVELHLAGESEEEKSNSNTNISFQGYQLAGFGVWPLPTGSYLDKKRGIFYWQPGVAFLGDYHLVFIKTGPLGKHRRKDVRITIHPRR
jgi:Leucine-rich repeat (LRR) protein